MGWFKLEGYDYSQWNYWRNEYPKNHIEDIVSQTEGASWVPTTNYKLDNESMETVTAKGTKDQFPYYIKYEDAEGTCWYYFRSGLFKTLNTNKQGKLEYYVNYTLDMYQTIWQRKLAKLRISNPNVFAKYAFGNRLGKTSEGDYYLDIVKDQKYLGNWIEVGKIEKVKKDLISYNEQEFFDLQNYWITYDNISGQFSGPSGGKISIIYSNGTITDYLIQTNHWNQIIKCSKAGGKYQYIVCKGSSYVAGTFGSLSNYWLNNSIIIIPLLNPDWEGLPFKFCDVRESTGVFSLQGGRTPSEEEIQKLSCDLAMTPSTIFNAINSIDLEGENFYAYINPTGDNFIGIWSTDIPFVNMLYNMNYSTYDRPRMICGFQNDCWILAMTIPLSYNLTTKILKETDIGIQKRINYIVENKDKLLPETETWLLHPYLYNEVFNNGVSGINIDLSLIKPTYNSNIEINAYLNPLNNLGIAYRFNSVNENNSGYDNTNSLISEIGNPIMFFGSSASTYLTNNISTLSTAQANVQDQQRLLNLNMATSFSQQVMGTATGSHGPLSFIGNLWNLGSNLAKYNESYERQSNMMWRNYNSQVTNIKSAPSQTLSTKSEKASLPHVHSTKPIFEWEIMEAQQNTLDLYFSWYLHNGYPYNAFVEFNDIENRQYMNIYSISSEVSGEYILDAIADPTDPFNDEVYNKAFLLWLEGTNKIYTNNTWSNVYNWKETNYVHNVEKNL